MPSYLGPCQAVLIRENTQQFFWNNETVPAGATSIAFQFARIASGFYYPWGASVEIAFSGNPGPFRVDVQTADTDQNANYILLVSATTNLNSYYVGSVQLLSFWAKYIRLNLGNLTNSVNITAKLTR